ncbi:MAG: carboxypeptidase-like regulatory domain-containing protein [Bacteroidota bacterium]|nr:carboxypeptidase-like regulatory domain-containing protein [Candidatus Kapabacteria bacterium]MDW8219600.1 carboxypeptidase-like regulatory domain-containing protein [Bacteroidota bacterium]
MKIVLLRLLYSALLPLVSCWLLCNTTFSDNSYAQPSLGGTISGTIRDNETGEILRGATVQVLDTKKGAIADVKGTYTVKGLPAGTYALRFNYVSFKPKIVEGVTVADGQTVVINVVLESAIKKTEEIVVQASRINDNAAAILAQRKNAAQLSDGISEAEIKKLPDADAGQALRRVPGVTLVGEKFVYVRGVSERYNNTTLNGAALSSTEPDKKAFAFDMFPSEFLQNANVSKSFTPDLPGNFAGGLVQLNTVDFPEGFSLRFSVSSAYNTNVTLQPDRYFSAPTSNRDWIADGAALRALPVDFPENRRAMNELLAGVTRGDAAAIQRWTTLGRSMNANAWRTERATAAPNAGFSISFSNVYTLGDNDLGVIASFNYANSYGLDTIVRDGILADRSPLFQTSGYRANRSVNWGGLFNVAYKIGDHSSISFKNIYNRSADDESVILNGQDVGYQFLDLQMRSFQFVQKDLYSGQLVGEHTIKEANNLLIDWRAGYSVSQRDEPDFRRIRYARQLANPNDDFEAQVIQSQQGDGTRAGRFFSYLQESAITGAINATLPIPQMNMKVKAGGLFEQRSRSFNARSITIIEPRNGGINVDYAIPIDNLDRLFSPANFRIDGIGISEDTRLSDAYTAGETLIAGYTMVDMPIEVNGVELRLIGGARLEYNQQRLNGFAINDAPVEVNRPFLDVLPALNIIYKLDASTNIRVSASQTLTRPSLREFAPFAFFDFQQQALTQGNPELIRTLIQNYDIRLETFPAPGEVLSISPFYKVFTNAIEETIFPQQSELTRTFTNAQGIAYNYGVELEARKNLSFLFGDYGQNFVLSANLTLVQSQLSVAQGGVIDTRSMWGQSPYAVNVGIFFTEPTTKTSFNVAYNITGRRIIQVGQRGAYAFADPHIYELPRNVIDVSILQPVLDVLEIKFAARDILNQPLIWEQGGVTVASTVRGATYSLGISYRIR